MTSTDRATAVQPISINILIPRSRLRVITLLPTVSIASVKTVLPECDLIFDGQILSDHHTLEFYEISTNSCLVAVVKQSQPERNEAERWMKITRESDTFEESVRVIVNRSSRSESWRLQDVRALRLELRPRSFRKFCRDWTKLDLTARTEKMKTQIPEVATEVSEEPLPVCW